MRIPIDTDLTVFTITVANIVFGSLPQLRKNSIDIPVKYEIEEAPASALSDRQAAVFAPYDEKLAAMGYWPVCVYRVSNYGHNLSKSYVNPAETSRCIVLLVEVKTNVAGLKSVGSSCLLSFETWFADKTLLTTRNMKLKSLLDRPPYQRVQECPYITEPAEMKRVHDAEVAKIGCPLAPPSTAAQIFKMLHQEHDWFSEYQVAQGVYRLNPDRHSYAMSDKALRRGISNYFNPFVHRFYTWRFVPTALFAILLPILGVFKFVPAVAAAALRSDFPIDSAIRSVMLCTYAMAGVLIGFMFESAAFVWVFILTYIPLRILAPQALGSVPYGSFAGVVAHLICQAKQHSRSVLLPRGSR